MDNEENQAPLTVTDAQQKDFIWTWKSNGRSQKLSLWLPYFSRVEKIPRTKLWAFDYNGGRVLINLDQLDFIMFYGATGELPLNFLDELATRGIVFLIHKRNSMHPYVFYPPVLLDQSDVLTRQILVREHDQKKTYVAKVLIKARLDRFSENPTSTLFIRDKLSQAKNVDEVRRVEATATAKYWKQWFAKLGLDEGRREDGAVQAALDAGSKFMFGVVLRWVLLHKLSPAHGFLHEPSSYQSLIYDLMEPYRYMIEDAVAKAWETAGNDKQKLTAHMLNQLKRDLEEIVYVPATRQNVRRKNLLHGVVLALRSYLLGESKRLVIPTEGKKLGGRPPKVSYKLPGEVR